MPERTVANIQSLTYQQIYPLTKQQGTFSLTLTSPTEGRGFLPSGGEERQALGLVSREFINNFQT